MMMNFVPQSEKHRTPSLEIAAGVEERGKSLLSQAMR
jgi:hypothetical protein